MRPTLGLLLRARPRRPVSRGVSLAQLLELENDPRIPVFVKALAAVRAHYALEPGSPSFWQNLAKFEKIEAAPAPELLPFLEKLVGTNLGRGQAEIVGNIAYKSGILDSLPHEFRSAYLRALSNPYRAIELARRWQLPPRDLTLLYIRANQLEAAEARTPTPDDGLVVEMVVGYACRGDQTAADRWIARLVAPTPQHLQKIRHFMTLYNLDLSIPAFGIERERRPRLEPKEKRVVTAINKLLALHPRILQGEIYQLWARLLLGDTTVLRALLEAAAAETTLARGELREILKTAPHDIMLWLVEKMNYGEFPQMLPEEWCTVLKRLQTPGYPVELMVEQIKFADCLTPNVVSALCRHSPRGLAELVLGLDAPTDHQLLSAWKAGPTREECARLEPLTLAAKPSLYLLRAILSALAAHHDYLSGARWVHRYNSQGILIPPRLLKELAALLSGRPVLHSAKFARAGAGQPTSSTYTLLAAILPPWIDKKWVMERI